MAPEIPAPFYEPMISVQALVVFGAVSVGAFVGWLIGWAIVRRWWREESPDGT